MPAAPEPPGHRRPDRAAARRVARPPPIRGPTHGPRSCCACRRPLRGRSGPGRGAGQPSGPRSWSTRLVDDDLVASLLLVHGLHPESLAHRVEEALARCGRLLAAHGGDVELLGIDDEAGAVRLRLLGSCDGCPSSSVTLQLAVERAIVEAAPEIVRIDVDQPSPRPAGRAGRPRRQAVYESARRRWRARERPGLGDPLAVLQRIRQLRPRPVGAAPGERCELCAEPIADEHGHLVDLAGPQPAVRLPGLLPAVHLRGRGRRRITGPCPTATCAFPTSRLSPAQWESLADPGRRRLLLPQLGPGPGGRLLPGAGRRHRVGAAPRHLGGGGGRQPGAGDARSPTSRRSWSRAEPGAGGAECFVVPDRRLLRAGRPPAPAVARLRRRPRGPRGAGRVLRAGTERRPR